MGYYLFSKLKTLSTSLLNSISEISFNPLSLILPAVFCKMTLAFLDMDDEIQKKLSKRIEALRKEVERLFKKENKKTPYRSFLTWILSIEKHLQFSINRDNDLEYLVEATTQMLNFYDNQKRQLEENKAKR